MGATAKMLSKSGSTIRKLVSPRKTVFVEEYEGSYFHHDDEGLRAVYRELKMRSWGLRRSSKPDLSVPKKDDLHKILTIVPPLPDTPLSSRSSLSSCGYSTDHTSPQCSSQRVGGQSPHKSPLLCPEHLEYQPQQAQGQSQPASTTPVTPPRTPSSQELHHIVLLPPSPPLQQDEPHPGYTTRRPSITLTGLGINHQSISTEKIAEDLTGSSEQHRLQSNGYSNDIQQLSPKMDRAFQPQRSSVGIKPPLPALVIPTTTYYSANHTKPLTPVHSPSQRSQARRRGQASLQSQTQPSKGSFMLTSPARFASAGKTKRRKSKKSHRRSRIVSTQVSKWALPDTARNLLERLNPIEADEVLPESILQEILDRACLVQSTMNDEVMATSQEGDQSSQQPVTPVEPFHLDDLPTRIDNAGVSLTVTSASPSPETAQLIQSGQGEITRDDCVTPKPHSQEHGQKKNQSNSPSVTLGENGKDHSLPIMFRLEEEVQSPKPSSVAHLTPSTTGPIRPVPRRTPSRQLPPLPTIPEGITSSMLTPTTTSSPGFGFDTNNDEFIYLKSTPFTWTMPLFRHGPIRLPKPEQTINQLAANAEDGLDWVAFQISIGSGIGDFDSDPLDYSRPSDAELNERDDILAWFSGFGFDGYGGLRTSPTREEEAERLKQKQERVLLQAQSAIAGGGTLNTSSRGKAPTGDELRRIQHLHAFDWDRKHAHERSASVNDQILFYAPATHIAAHQMQQQHYLPWIPQETPSTTWSIERQPRDHLEKPTINSPFGHTHSQSWSYSVSPLQAPTSHPTGHRDHSRGRSSSDVANNNTNTNTNNNNTPVPTSINRNQSPTLRTSTTPTKNLPTPRLQPQQQQQQSSLALTSSSLFSSSPTMRSESPFLPAFGFQQHEHSNQTTTTIPTTQPQNQNKHQHQPSITRQTAKKIPQAIDAARARHFGQQTLQGQGQGAHHRHRRTDSQESIKSLPQSPALNMVVSRDVNGQEYVIPMGFNLDHDLGDFLKWEAEHVAFGID